MQKLIRKILVYHLIDYLITSEILMIFLIHLTKALLTYQYNNITSYIN